MIRISVITAVYNRRDTVAQALTSVFTQSHPQTESIIIDGGSSDGTWEVIESYRSKAGYFVSEPDKGLYDALNKGVSHATGDVVGFMHADDVFADPHVLAAVAMAFEQDPTIEAVYGDLLYVRHGDVSQVVRYWRAGSFAPGALRKGWMPPHPTLYVRRSAYQRLGGFDVRYRISADYDWMLRFLGCPGIRVAYLPQVMVKMRVGGASNRSLGNILRKSREDLQAMRHHGIGGLGTLLQKNIGKLGQFRRR